ncbi:hypothetical protein B0H17DRAFT_1145032 [Mycena rosella]|uniref:Uncharacterized protein n=1 Tax=Mycena rosella TaxID=1033263 RepID=A0AAD7CSX0_MYCRO|nr:hypothetical protein B0H17DRAFT_1145032 [Mycena rosella]
MYNGTAIATYPRTSPVLVNASPPWRRRSLHTKNINKEVSGARDTAFCLRNTPFRLQPKIEPNTSHPSSPGIPSIGQISAFRPKLTLSGTKNWLLKLPYSRCSLPRVKQLLTAMSDVVNSADAWPLVLEALCLGSTTLVLYGLYVPIFILSIQTVNHHNAPGRRPILATTSLMFILGTGGTLLIVTEVGLVTRFTKTAFQGSPDLSRLLGVFRGVELAEVVRFALNNRIRVPGRLITDSMVPSFYAARLGNKGPERYFGFSHPRSTATLVDYRAPYIMNLATNLLLMCLTAGRIWYIGRQVRIVHEGNLGKQYNTAIALLNSINDFIPTQKNKECIFSGVTAALVGQTMNIAPAMILVRAGRGRWPCIEDATSLAPSEGPAGGIVFNSFKPKTSYPNIEIS